MCGYKNTNLCLNTHEWTFTNCVNLYYRHVNVYINILKK
ncbi:MAG: hypothetical protein LBB45_06370 [Methanobrevibacter sp.]|nr:hypothetical protein [Candidatus Methanovirga basalitermitum]